MKNAPDINRFLSPL